MNKKDYRIIELNKRKGGFVSLCVFSSLKELQDDENVFIILDNENGEILKGTKGFYNFIDREWDDKEIKKSYILEAQEHYLKRFLKFGY